LKAIIAIPSLIPDLLEQRPQLHVLFLLKQIASNPLPALVSARRVFHS